MLKRLTSVRQTVCRIYATTGNYCWENKSTTGVDGHTVKNHPESSINVYFIVLPFIFLLNASRKNKHHGVLRTFPVIYLVVLL